MSNHHPPVRRRRSLHKKNDEFSQALKKLWQISSLSLHNNNNVLHISFLKT